MIDFAKTFDILMVDEAVRYVGIIDSAGNIVASKSRGGDMADDEVFRFDQRILKSVLDVENDIHGKAIRIHTTREKIEQFVYYCDNLIIYVTCDPRIEHKRLLEISDKIQDIIGQPVETSYV